MARYTGSKHKLVRREGVNVLDKNSNSLLTRITVNPGELMLALTGSPFRVCEATIFDTQISRVGMVREMMIVHLPTKYANTIPTEAVEAAMSKATIYAVDGWQMENMLSRRIDGHIIKSGENAGMWIPISLSRYVPFDPEKHKVDTDDITFPAHAIYHREEE